jgi:hypothetical protein
MEKGRAQTKCRPSFCRPVEDVERFVVLKTVERKQSHAMRISADLEIDCLLLWN